MKIKSFQGGFDKNLSYLIWCEATHIAGIVDASVNMKEINKTLKLYKNKNKNKIALLHCVSNYPCKLSSINLSFLKQLGKEKNLGLDWNN